MEWRLGNGDKGYYQERYLKSSITSGGGFEFIFDLNTSSTSTDNWDDLSFQLNANGFSKYLKLGMGSQMGGVELFGKGGTRILVPLPSSPYPITYEYNGSIAASFVALVSFLITHYGTDKPKFPSTSRTLPLLKGRGIWH